MSPDRCVVACNYAVGTSPVAEGALCYVADVAFKQADPDRIRIIARSRSGRWIDIWQNIRRLKRFRLKTLPPEHPRYRDWRIPSAHRIEARIAPTRLEEVLLV